MRSRSRNQVRHGKYHSHGTSASGIKLWDFTDPYIFSWECASMRDSLGVYEQWKPCFHTSRYASSSSVSLPKAAHITSGDRATVRIEDPCAIWGITPPDGHDPVIDWTAAMQELIEDASGAMPLQAALVVNAVEFASLKDLVPGLLKGFKTVAKNRSLFKKSSWKELAGSHLAYSFGLAPLVADFRGFLGTRGAIKKRRSELLRRNGRAIRLAKRCQGTGERNFDYNYSSDNPYHNLVAHYSDKAKAVGTLSARVTSFFDDGPSSQCKLWSSALGLSSPLTNAWELIPFSFVVDWFIPIGDAFKRLENKLGLHETVRQHELSQFWTSVKTVGELTGTGIVRSQEFPSWNSVVWDPPTVSYRHFSRVEGIPLTGVLGSPSGWSMNRTALSVSLILQKVLK